MGNQIQVPYTAHVPGPVNFGTGVVLSGRALQNCRRFSVNLCASPGICGNVPLHVNPRFDKGYTCCNSMHSGSWKMEEKTSHFPFKRNGDFEMQIIAMSYGYQVVLNGTNYCQFSYRLPKEMVKFLYIAGDVYIYHVAFIEEKTSPPPAPLTYPSPAPPPYSEVGPIFLPTVPVNMPIPQGMFPGKIILISGVPKQGASRFSVNLVCGANDESSDIALHFDVRFNFGNFINVVVRNHKEAGQWGNSERNMKSFPFIIGQPFELMILAETGCFKIAVNNQHFVQFNHRIRPVGKVTHLHICRDVKLSQICFQ